MPATRRRRHRAPAGHRTAPEVETRQHGLGTGLYALIATLILSACLLFFRLGHYSLWDDEAGTALNAKSILATGDTSAQIDDHNVFAYRGGVELQRLKNRYVPPLAAGVTAASFWLHGRADAFTSRVPFAILGLVTVVLLFWTVQRGRDGPAAAWILAAAVLGNVSFFLFSRQSRYYALTMLLSVAIALVYAHGRTVWTAGLMAVLSILLFASNYLNYIALHVCLGVDYFFWRRHVAALSRREWASVLIPQVLVCGAIGAIWNPLRSATGAQLHFTSLADKASLFAGLWRQISENEFVCIGLVAAAVALAWGRRDQWLFRGVTALVIYVAVVTILTPRWPGQPLAADVRYLAPLIPLGMLLTVRTMMMLPARRGWLTVPIVLIASGSNLFHGGPLLSRGLRSSIAEYVNELRDPPGDPFRIAADWIHCHVRPRESIAVLPDYMMYPLMFHASHATYAWQFPPEARRGLSELPPIHFLGLEEPTYLLAFGPSVEIWSGWSRAGAPYVLHATLSHFWRDRHRPELTLHGFAPVENYDARTEAIYVFKRK
jgi:hypothetical protein